MKPSVVVERHGLLGCGDGLGFSPERVAEPELVRPLWESLGCPADITLPELVAPLFEKAEGVLEDALA